MSLELINFANTETSPTWIVVDDVVMGGRSAGNLERLENGHLLFFGRVSTENNGGFSSVRFQIPTIDIGSHTHTILSLKGDGKSYQFRIKDDRTHTYAYSFAFKTSGNWEEIKIPLNQMVPKFRGRRVNLPKFSQSNVQELGFLIANQRDENFQLEIHKISLS